MDKDRKPAYWAVLPAKVRYDGTLRPNAKLLYAEITALAGEGGYCWASNDYLAKLFEIKPRTVSDLIGTLADRGYIKVDVLRDPKNNAVVERRIWVDDSVDEDELPPIADFCYTPIAKNGDTSIAIAKNGDTPIADFGYTPIAKNGYKNNLDINNIPPKAPQRGRKRRECKSQPDWKPERFARFWDFYAHKVRGESKQAAIRAWDKLRPDDELIYRIGQALLLQLRSDSWKAGIGIPYASTYLNNRRWEDVPMQLPAAPEQAGGWAEDPEVM